MPTFSKDNPLKALFISRTFPPVKGGMEKASYMLIHSVAKEPEIKVTAIVNRQGKGFLPIFLPGALIRAILIGRKFQLVHLSDGVLAPIGDILRLIYPKLKTAITLHGLDVTYAKTNPLYRKINWEAIKNLDYLIAVSEATKEAAIAQGADPKKITVIPNGIEADEVYDNNLGRADLEELLKDKGLIKKDGDYSKTVWLLTLGRLAKRKGIAWFVEKVAPQLKKEVKYLIAGGGVEGEAIKEKIKAEKLEGKAIMLGPVTEQEKKVLYNGCDIFVQPNIPVEGDMEGFGIVLLEIASAGKPVVASRLEGIKDAIDHKSNGLLLEPKDTEAYIKTINRLAEDEELRQALGEKARSFTLERFGWEKIIRAYKDLFLGAGEEIKNN